MKTFCNKFSLHTCLILTTLCFAVPLKAQPLKERLVILADMGNEPDEEQQIVHLMMCSNEFELEGLVAVTGKYLNPEQKRPYRQVLHPELFFGIIDGYEKVVENLKIHETGWPEPDYLRSIVANGQTGYGVAAIGPGKSSPGSKLLIDCITKDDPRPLYVVVNAGSNTLAQSLIDYEAGHSKKEMNAFVSKLRVFENGAQDDAGAWICAKYPAIHWTRSNFQTYCYGGPDFESGKPTTNKYLKLGPYTWAPYEYSAMGQHQWALENIKGDHGPLGSYWPLRQTIGGKIVFLEGGGTVPWLGLIHQGLSDINHPSWGGWSGRFTSEKVKNVWSKHASVKENEVTYGDFELFTEATDQWTDPESGMVYNDNYTPVWRWRKAFFNDFVCRMDWCISDYHHANHHPVAAINGDRTEKIHTIKAKPGETVELNAGNSTDPDNDELQYKWWIYSEAGTYGGAIPLKQTTGSTLSFPIPKDAGGTTIHLILEVNDVNSIASLYDYRRVIFEVK